MKTPFVHRRLVATACLVMGQGRIDARYLQTQIMRPVPGNVLLQLPEKTLEKEGGHKQDCIARDPGVVY